LLYDDRLDGPEIEGKLGAGEVAVTDAAVAVDAPSGRPGATDEEHPALIAIPNVLLDVAHHAVQTKAVANKLNCPSEIPSSKHQKIPQNRPMA
jgi:hypothetical protein